MSHNSFEMHYASRAGRLARRSVETVTDSFGHTQDWDTWRTFGPSSPWRHDGRGPHFKTVPVLMLDGTEATGIAAFVDAITAELDADVPGLATHVGDVVTRMAKAAVPQMSDLRIGSARRLYDAASLEWVERRSDRAWVCVDDLSRPARFFDDLAERHGPLSPHLTNRRLGIVGQQWDDIALVESDAADGTHDLCRWHAVDKHWIRLADETVVDDPHRRGRPVLVLDPANAATVKTLAADLAEHVDNVTPQVVARAIIAVTSQR